MNTIEIIGIAVSTIGIVLGGVWFIVQRAMSSAVDKHRLDSIEKKTSDMPCEQNRDDIRQGIAENKAILKRMEESDAKIKELPCERHQEDIRQVQERQVSSLEKLDSNNGMLVDISKWIMKIDPNMIETLARKASPYKMTGIGEIVFELSGAKKAISDNADYLIGRMESINPNTAYDVEDGALTVLLQSRGMEMFDGIKSYLYNSPETIKMVNPDTGKEVDVKLSMQGVLKIMSIDLRDRYLECHRDIKA